MKSDIQRAPVRRFSRLLWRLGLTWRQLMGVILPIALLPLLFIEDDDIIGEGSNARKSTKFKAAYTILLVALYWMLEVMPLAVTSLLPIVLFPFLGVLSTKQISPSYFKDTNVMFFGGLVLALAVEYCKLHRRIALKVMTIVGSSPIPLLFGVMSTSMFLSMWMSNTTCCAMMLPILIAVLDQLSGSHSSTKKESESNLSANVSSSVDSKHGASTIIPLDTTAFSIQKWSSSEKFRKEAEKKKWENVRKMYLFGVAYASNLGGTATITGTGSNLVFQAQVNARCDVSQKGRYLDMTFTNWMALNVPATIINVLMTFTYLVIVFYGIPNFGEWPLISLFFKKRQKSKEDMSDEEDEKNKIRKANDLIKREYDQLGPMKFHEAAVFVIFLFVICLWVFREPKFMSGWNDAIEGADIGEATAAIIGIVLMFLVPRDLTFITGIPKPGESYEALLDWKYVQSNLPWGAVLLLGGGFALSDGAEASGLSQWIGDQLTSLHNLPSKAILIIVMILCASVTEVCTNVVAANVILPILLTMSYKINIHPLYLTVPATISCSFAFMLPVATPPNALVFSAGNLRITDMVKTGAFLNVACISMYFLVQISLGQLLFNYNDYEYVEKCPR